MRTLRNLLLVVVLWFLLIPFSFWLSVSDQSKLTIIEGSLQNEKWKFINDIKVTLLDPTGFRVLSKDWKKWCSWISDFYTVPKSWSIIRWSIFFECYLEDWREYNLFFTEKDKLIHKFVFIKRKSHYFIWENSVDFNISLYSKNHLIVLNSEKYRRIRYEEIKKSDERIRQNIESYYSKNLSSNIKTIPFIFKCKDNSRVLDKLHVTLFYKQKKEDEWLLLWIPSLYPVSFNWSEEKVLKYNDWNSVIEKKIRVDSWKEILLRNCNIENSITKEKRLSKAQYLAFENKRVTNLIKEKDRINSKDLLITDKKWDNSQIDIKKLWKKTKIKLLWKLKNNVYSISLNWESILDNKYYEVKKTPLDIEIYKNNILVYQNVLPYKADIEISLKTSFMTYVYIWVFSFLLLSFLFHIYCLIREWLRKDKIRREKEKGR